MLLFILGNLTVILSAFFWTRTFYSKERLADFMLIWFLFFFMEIILVELVLGIFGVLFPTNILLLHTLILLVAFSILKRKSLTPLSYRLDFSFIFQSKILLFAISIFLGFFALKIWINLNRPPYGADALAYHLSYPATWMKRGDLYNPMLVFGVYGNLLANGMPYFPINGELFFYWLMLPFRNAFLANIGQVLFYFIAILAIYSILKKFNLASRDALLIAFLWALIPNVFKHIEDGAYIDIICAAVFLLCLNFMLLCERFSLKNAVLFGISFGIFLGIKRHNIFWSIGLMPLFLYIYLKAKANASKKICGIFIIIFFIFLFGSYSYIKSYFLTGNFLYPFKVTFLGKTILPGYLDKQTMAPYYSIKYLNWDELLFGEGLGSQLFIFILPATILPLVLSPILRKKFKPLVKFLLIFIIPVFMFLVFLFCIKIYFPRYLFPYFAVSFICAALFLNQFKWGPKFIRSMGVVSVLTSFGEFCGHIQLVVSLILSLFIYLIFFLYNKFKNKISKNLKLFFLVLFLLSIIFVLWFLSIQYDSQEFNRYELLFIGKESEDRDVGRGWKWMNENSAIGSRIAYAGRINFYPLFGRKIKNSVFYISVNNKPSLPHYYPDGLYRREKVFLNWRDNLRKEAIDYLFIMQSLPCDREPDALEGFPIEDKWASEHPQMFRLVFSNSRVKVYSLVK
ncbi:MAG: hypothetical protein A2166_02605 [Omnitrophica WOR_2 bacterium RBG_13_41_10]|nr:MAG: hypothetical protein A2166_02605 [Omnitrophica WOR_2 bacterium RBG_13_41_10]